MESDLDRIVMLRYEILRKPWNQPLASARDGEEASACNAFIENKEGQVVACGRLQALDPESGQIRYMAVAETERGKGMGIAILKFLEEEAKRSGMSHVVLQARENAVSFYEAQNYRVRERSFLLWGIIQHYLMEKAI